MNISTDLHRVNQLGPLHSDTAQELFSSMPPVMAQKFKDSYLKWIAGKETAFIDNKKELRKYLSTTSSIAAATDIAPGCGETFHYLYEKIAINPVDQYFCDSPAGHQIYRRLKITQQKLPEIIARYFPDKPKILIDNICSGQGYDMIEVLRKNPELKKRCHVRNIDIDKVALEQGRKRILEYGLSDCFEIVCKDAARVKSRNADFGILSGVFCPTPMAESEKIMNFMVHRKAFIRKGGIWLYNATTNEMLREDPLTDWIMRIGNWNMDYKSQSDIEAIATTNGLKVKETFSDEKNFNVIIIAKV